MAEKIGASQTELAEHERAAGEVTRLRRKGIPCHLEVHPGGIQSRVDVIRDDSDVEGLLKRNSATLKEASRKGR